MPFFSLFASVTSCITISALIVFISSWPALSLKHLLVCNSSTWFFLRVNCRRSAIWMHILQKIPSVYLRHSAILMGNFSCWSCARHCTMLFCSSCSGPGSVPAHYSCPAPGSHYAPFLLGLNLSSAYYTQEYLKEFWTWLLFVWCIFYIVCVIFWFWSFSSSCLPAAKAPPWPLPPTLFCYFSW